jgi:hypothetical protein
MIAEWAQKLPRYDNDCAEMIVEEGWLDRDCGSGGKALAKDLIRLINEPGGASSEAFAAAVNVESWLRNMAFYAVVQSHDSPLHNGNNWFVVNEGDEQWQIMQYDHNNMGQPLFCGTPLPGQPVPEDGCGFSDLVHWSITRPTCGPLSTNPRVYPLLKEQRFMDMYIKYIEEFLPIFEDTTFIKEQAKRMRKYMKDDPFAEIFKLPPFAIFDVEVSDDFTLDMAQAMGMPMPPLVAFINERAAAVRAQLADLKSGAQPAFLDPEKDAKLKVCATAAAMMDSAATMDGDATTDGATTTQAPVTATQAKEEASSALGTHAQSVVVLLAISSSVFFPA